MKLDEAIGEMKKRLSFLPINQYKLEPARSRDYIVKAHWALYCENYLEGFHIPFIHNSLNSVIDYGTYTTELYRYSNLQLALSKGGEDVFDLPKDASYEFKYVIDGNFVNEPEADAYKWNDFAGAENGVLEL